MSSPSRRVSQRIVFLVAIGLAVFSCAGLLRLQTEANYRVYFDAHDPLMLAQAAVAERFAQGESALLILGDSVERLLSSELLSAVAEFESSLLRLSYVDSVRGFHQIVAGGGQTLADDPFADDEEPLSPELRWRQLRASSPGRPLLAAGGDYALIEVQLALPTGDSVRSVQQAMMTISQLATTYLVEGAQLRSLDFSGVLVLNHAYIDVVRHDLRVFLPALLVSMVLVLYGFLRHWKLVVLPLATGLLAAAMAMGATGWAGWTLAAINAFVPVIILSLHLAACMHLMVSFGFGRAEGLSSRGALEQALFFNRRPLALSALTTAAGFLLLGFSPSPPIRVVGSSVAIGVLISYLINRWLVPILLFRMSLPQACWQRVRVHCTVLPRRLATAVTGRQVLYFTAGLALLALLALPRASIDDSVYSYFPPEHAFSLGIDRLDRYFAGAVRLSYGFSGAEPGAVLEEHYRDVQEGFTRWLREQPEVAEVEDIYAVLERRGLDLGSAAALLKNRTVRQLGVQQLVDPDAAATRVAVSLPVLSSAALIDFDARARDWLDRHSGVLQPWGGSGADLVFAHLGRRNALSMFASLSVALLGVGLLLGLLFRDWRMAMLGLSCNFLPLLLVYAVWFWSGGFISLGAAVVLGMIAGVIVDDTLHLLCKFQQLRRQCVPSPVSELRRRALPAVVVTSVCLVVGFSVGFLSDFRPLRELSVLSAAVVGVALLVDAMVLPVVLDKWRGGDR